jgi:hypothetical protein
MASCIIIEASYLPTPQSCASEITADRNKCYGQMLRSRDKPASRTESALDGITERARNRLIGMALEGLFATGEVSSMSPATAAAFSSTQKGKRVTWEANVAGGYPTTKATIEGALNLDSEPLVNDKEDSVTSLEPDTAPPEDLITAGFAEVDFISHNAERHIDSGTLERGDRNVNVAIRASVQYPEPLFLHTVMNFETENTTIGNLSESFRTAIIYHR